MGGRKTRAILSLLMEGIMDNNILLATLTKETIAHRLNELLSNERKVMIEFLTYLAEFDRRQLYLNLGFGSLFDYCVRKLHLSKGSAYRRSVGARLLRRFPKIADYLSDGRLSLSTLVVLKNVINDENANNMLTMVSFKSKEEAEIITAQFSPAMAVKESVRKVGLPKVIIIPQAEIIQTTDKKMEDGAENNRCVNATIEQKIDTESNHGQKVISDLAPKTLLALVSRTKPDAVKAISEDLRVLKVTVSKECIEELNEIRVLLSHKIPSGAFESIIREGFTLIRKKYGKLNPIIDQKHGEEELQPETTKFAEEPQSGVTANHSVDRERFSGEPQQGVVANHSVDHERFSGEPQVTENNGNYNRYIPMLLQREIWKQAHGRCTFQSTDGIRCNSKYQLEFEHILPVSRGGESTRENLTLLCKNHNLWRAKKVFGQQWMKRFLNASQ